MKTNSNVLSGKFRFASVAIALFLLPVAAAAQAGNSGRDRRGNINPGRVGVTTVEPGEKLDLNAKLRVRSGAFFLENTALLRAGRGNRKIASSLSFDAVVLGTTNASDYLVFNAGGAERARISTDGNVGIGTTSPRVKLDVYGAFFNRTGADQNIVWQDSGSEASMGIYNDALNAFEPITLNSSRFAFMNGNVGIGTTSPAAKLHIVTTGIPFTIDAGNNLDYFSLATGASTTGISGRVANANLGNSSAWFGVQTNSDNNPNSGFYVKGTAGSNPVFIASTNGRVGIGTTSPAVKLHIVGSGQALVVDAGNNSDYFALQTLSSTAGVSGRVTGASLGNSSAWFGIQTNSDNNANSGFYVKGTSGSNPVFTVNTAGNINISGTVNAKYQDVAEWVPSSEQLSAGTVVVLDSTKSNQVTSSSVSYDTRVAGVVSEQPGIALGEKSDGKVLVATTGRVRVKVDASKGPIHIGDLLVTSDIPGVAMKSEPVNLGGVQLHRPGTLIGKALEPLEKGKGEILVLLSLQ